MWNFLKIQLIYFYNIYYMFMLVIEENMQMFYVFNNNMLSWERNKVSINLYINCIDYIVKKKFNRDILLDICDFFLYDFIDESENGNENNIYDDFFSII